MTDYRKKHLRDTIKAINALMEQGNRYVDTKIVRRILNIPSSDRSSINFIWRALDTLKDDGYLDINGRESPRLYIIRANNKLNFENENCEEDK